jgi:predicted RecA/RadA family phage recombinase
MNNYVKPGDSVEFIAPSGGVVSGTAYLIGALLVVAAVSAAQGEKFSGRLMGVFTLPKATGSAWTEGEKLYWDNTAKNITDTASGNTLVGSAYAAAASGDASGQVRLDGIVR